MTINKLKEFVFHCKMLNDIFVKCLLYSFLKVGYICILMSFHPSICPSVSFILSYTALEV
jgi:hypothetical protein